MPYALCPMPYAPYLIFLRKAICIFPLIYLNLDRQSQIYHLKLTLSLIFSPQPHRIGVRRKPLSFG